MTDEVFHRQCAVEENAEAFERVRERDCGIDKMNGVDRNEGQFLSCSDKHRFCFVVVVVVAVVCLFAFFSIFSSSLLLLLLLLGFCCCCLFFFVWYHSLTFPNSDRYKL